MTSVCQKYRDDVAPKLHMRFKTQNEKCLEHNTFCFYFEFKNKCACRRPLGADTERETHLMTIGAELHCAQTACPSSLPFSLLKYRFPVKTKPRARRAGEEQRELQACGEGQLGLAACSGQSWAALTAKGPRTFLLGSLKPELAQSRGMKTQCVLEELREGPRGQSPPWPHFSWQPWAGAGQ